VSELATPNPLQLHEREIPRYIAVEGPIGAGKTSLAKKLADTFNCHVVLEKAEENPFLERFYQSRRQAALATQLFFLFQRTQQIQDLRQSDLFEQVRIADFLIEKDRMFAQVNLDDDELKLYETVYQQLTIDAPSPDLVIYLQAPVDVLLQRIQQRGVAAEQQIDSLYLEQLNEAYSRFFHYYDDAPLLIVNATQIDLVNNNNQYLQFVDYLLNIRTGRHYYNPTFFPDYH
jgi:deoxyadenosine/deoxycytidine kinase